MPVGIVSISDWYARCNSSDETMQGLADQIQPDRPLLSGPVVPPLTMARL